MNSSRQNQDNTFSTKSLNSFSSSHQRHAYHCSFLSFTSWVVRNEGNSASENLSFSQHLTFTHSLTCFHFVSFNFKTFYFVFVWALVVTLDFFFFCFWYDLLLGSFGNSDVSIESSSSSNRFIKSSRNMHWKKCESFSDHSSVNEE